VTTVTAQHSTAQHNFERNSINLSWSFAPF